MTAATPRAITRTPDVCGGRARIEGTRLPVWLLVLQQRTGASEADILRNYPSLAAADLDAAWDYYRRNALEIDRDIWWQDTAGNIAEAEPVPNAVIVEGLLLGVDDATLRTAFDPPLTDTQIATAWAEYRQKPNRVLRTPTALASVG